MENLRMVDLRGQYDAIKEEIDEAIQRVIDGSAFIRGHEVEAFETELSQYLEGASVVGVANGTDALQLAMMAMEIGEGDEVITPSFTFIATAEAAALLGARPVFADIDPTTFNLDYHSIESLITERTKAIVPVHLFGQPCDMDGIMEIAGAHGLKVIEDTAQGIGARYKGNPAGCIGHCGTLSFFPSKNLGAYGDGGAVITNDPDLCDRSRLIANHGSKKKYMNETVGVNSRLDGIQAAILRVKLGHLDEYNSKRRWAADLYDDLLSDCEGIEIPFRSPEVTHIFHQYTIRVTGKSTEDAGGKSKEDPRGALSRRLSENGIPHAVYYPVPLHRLPVFAGGGYGARWGSMVHTENAAREVLSLPMHTELEESQQSFIAETIRTFTRERK